MFGKRFRLFSILGFEVRIDLSWLVLGLLITWSLARGFFPFHYKNLPDATYWWMGIACAVGIFFSIVFHELCHSLVAKKYGLQMRGITLFIFGGVAEMAEEPPSARAEFFMAIAGPVASVVLSIIFYGVLSWSQGAISTAAYGVLVYLAIINLVLAGFNLLPAYPLDGGRVLRSILWRWKRNFRWATRLASQIGSGFGIALIFFGVVNVLLGNLLGGLWQAMIGMFLRTAAQSSYRQILMRRALEGETVAHFMKKDPVTASPSLSLRDLVEKYVYTYHYKMYPVVENGELLGCITTRQIKEIPKDQWEIRTVRECFTRYGPENTVTPDMAATKVLSTMSRTGNSRLLVVDGGRLVGIITLKDIMEFMAVKLDLDGDEDRG